MAWPICAIVVVVLVWMLSAFSGLVHLDLKRWLISVDRGEIVLHVVEERTNESTLEWLW